MCETLCVCVSSMLSCSAINLYFKYIFTILADESLESCIWTPIQCNISWPCIQSSCLLVPEGLWWAWFTWHPMPSARKSKPSSDARWLSDTMTTRFCGSTSAWRALGLSRMIASLDVASRNHKILGGRSSSRPRTATSHRLSAPRALATAFSSTEARPWGLRMPSVRRLLQAGRECQQSRRLSPSSLGATTPPSSKTSSTPPSSTARRRTTTRLASTSCRDGVSAGPRFNRRSQDRSNRTFSARKTPKMLSEVVEKFQASAEWYLIRDVPYRGGYLPLGPPGTGKSSFTQAVAGAFNLNICFLNLSGYILCKNAHDFIRLQKAVFSWYPPALVWYVT